MFRKMEITVELTQDLEAGGYVAYCPELDIATEGETVEEATSMMKEAAEGYIEILGKDKIPYFRTGEGARVVRRLELVANV
ncbi:MAG: type II toxin-antitoxin system HicB family antitoxin [Candidatus Methanospirareceae archaeon]